MIARAPIQRIDGCGTDMSERDDNSLLTAIAQRRDRAAFTQLCERYRNRAYSHAFRILRNAALAEDAVQEAMLSIWLTQTNQPTGDAEHWVASIVIHKSIDLRRSRRQSAKREERVVMERSSPGGRQSTVAADIEKDELVGALRNHIDQLPELECQLLTCCYGANMPHQKIAELFDMSRSRVTEKIQEALARLRANLTRAGVAAVVPLVSAENLLEAMRSGYECPPGLTEKILSRIDSAGFQTAKALSRRAARVARTGVGGWAAVAAGVAAVVAAIGAYLWSSRQRQTPPAPPAPSVVAAPAAPVQAPAPGPAPAAGPKVIKVIGWNFDNGLPAEFATRGNLVKDRLGLDWPLPEWVRDGGVGHSGGLKFPASGASLFLPAGVPVNKLPIIVEFDLWVLDASNMMIGVCEGNKGGMDRSKYLLKLEKNSQLHVKSGSWMHVVRTIEEKKGVVVTQTLYDGSRGGDYVEEAREAWTDEYDLEYFEIYGRHFIVDNLKVTCGDGKE